MAKKGKSRPRGETAEGHGYWIFGTHAVQAALVNPARRAERLLATASAAVRLHDAGLPLEAPAPEIARAEEIERRLPPGVTHQGVALHARPLADTALADISGLADSQARIVVLDRVTDPRNVGAVLRAAAAFGAGAVIAPRRHSPPEGGALAKAASGALETVAFVRVANLARALDDIAELGFWRLGLDAEAPAGLDEARPEGRLALVLGAEGSGLRRLTMEHCDALARIEMAPGMESLNVSQATAIALYATRPPGQKTR